MLLDNNNRINSRFRVEVYDLQDISICGVYGSIQDICEETENNESLRDAYKRGRYPFKYIYSNRLKYQASRIKLLSTIPIHCTSLKRLSSNTFLSKRLQVLRIFSHSSFGRLSEEDY